MRTHSLILLLLPVMILGCLATSCKKDPDDPNDPNAPKGKVKIHLHTFVDEEEVDFYNITYSTGAGREMSLSLAQVYLSEFELVREEGPSYKVPGRVLKVQSLATYELGEVPAGDYKTLRFKVGLDAATNAVAPPTDADLLNHSEMWFDSTAQPGGYVFLNVQGMVDTSSGLSGEMAPFSYKIGTNNHYMTVTMPDNAFTVEEGKTDYRHLVFDVSRIFSGIQMNVASNLSVTTAAENSSTVAGQVAANIPLLFKYEL